MEEIDSGFEHLRAVRSDCTPELIHKWIVFGYPLVKINGKWAGSGKDWSPRCDDSGKCWSHLCEYDHREP